MQSRWTVRRRRYRDVKNCAAGQIGRQPSMIHRQIDKAVPKPLGLTVQKASKRPSRTPRSEPRTRMSHLDEHTAMSDLSPKSDPKRTLPTHLSRFITRAYFCSAKGNKVKR
jgi:hypothetical protein